jgi:hypothetical protein
MLSEIGKVVGLAHFRHHLAAKHDRRQNFT